MLFDLGNYLRVVRLGLLESASRRRRLTVLILLTALPALALLNSVCLALDRILFPSLGRIPIRSPLFIVGHARSGTTLMHRLLCGDSDRFAWFMTWELLLPSLLQKKAVRLAGRLDTVLLRGALARAITRWEDRTFAKGRQMHPMGLAAPEEDEFLMLPTFTSSTLVVFFPYMRELEHLYYFDAAPDSFRRRVLAYYAGCVRRQLALRGPDKMLCSKNPVFVPKLASLIESFPDARFIVMVRDPRETIPSLLKLMRRNWKATDCPPERMQDSIQRLAEQAFHTYRYPFEVLEGRPADSWTVIEYEELVREPRRVVSEVYRRFGLEMSEKFDRKLRAEECRSKEHRHEHVYSLDEFDLSADEIRRRLPDLFERFGWD